MDSQERPNDAPAETTYRAEKPEERENKKKKKTVKKIIVVVIWILVVALAIFLTLFIASKVGRFDTIADMLDYIRSQPFQM